jgi:hypothetical protein
MNVGRDGMKVGGMVCERSCSNEDERKRLCDK